MSNSILVNNKINFFKKKIIVSGDKSISIRWVLFSSLASGVSKSKNLLMSEDVLAALNVIKKLGIKSTIKKGICRIYGKGTNGYKYKKNISVGREKIESGSVPEEVRGEVGR